MKKFFVTVTVLLALILCLGAGLAGCGTPGGGGGKTLPDYDLMEDELSVIIAGWLGPEDLNSPEQIQLLEESGISTLFLGAAGDCVWQVDLASPTAADAELFALMKESGLAVYLNTGNWNEEGFSYIGNFNEYEAVKGIHFDEPNKAEIDRIAAKTSAFEEAGPEKIFYTNLFPSFSTEVQADFGVGHYRDYLTYYCDNVLEKLSGEKWLSADRYPLTFDVKGDPALDVGWLQDVEAVAEVAREYEGIKTNFFIQTMPYGGESLPAGQIGSRARIPTYEDIRLQEYALMAFGFDGISLFCYASPAVGPEFTEEQLAMLDREGDPTAIYTAAQKANREILAFDHVYLQFEWQGVFTNDGGSTADAESAGRTQNPSFSNLLDRMSLSQVACLSSVTSTEDTLFGYFLDNSDNEGFMIVNYNETTLELTDTVTMSFDPGYGYTKALCYIGGKEVTLDLTDNDLTLTLGSGEGVFVIPY